MKIANLKDLFHKTFPYYTAKGVFLSGISDVLTNAFEEGIEEILVSKEEYSQVTRFLISNGAWNWDMKTILGMKITVV